MINCLWPEEDHTINTTERWDSYHKAEKVLMDEMPIIPIYFYTEARLIRPASRAGIANLTDQHPYKYVPSVTRSADP